DQREGEQGPDRGGVCQRTQRDERGQDGDEHGGEQGVGTGRALGVELGEEGGDEPVARHRVQDPGLAVENDQDDAGQGQDGAPGEDDRPDGGAGDRGEDAGQGGLPVGEPVPVHGADGGERNEAVQGRDQDQREHDGAGQVALRVLGLLAGGGDRVETDVGEEQGGTGGADPGHPHGHERGEIALLHGGRRDPDEHDQDRDLDQDHDG